MPAFLRRRHWLLSAASIAIVVAAGVPRLASGQTVLLQIRPRVGDTLRMRLDQEVEQSGTTRRGQTDTTMQVLSRLQVLTRSIIERSEPAGTVVLSITDSVVISTTGFTGDSFEEARRSLQGQRLRMRVAPDGSTDVLEERDASPELRGLFTQMPATLPKQAIAVGESWSRTMTIPLAGQPGRKGAGTLKATFHFDSLSAAGDHAYLSMRGTLARDGDAMDSSGIRYDMSGVMSGSMIVDRRRGWLTSSHTVITVRSIVSPPAGTHAEPMRFRMKVTQWLRAM